MRLLLIRHGHSDHAPFADRGLTTRGRRQVRELAEQLRRSEAFASCSQLLSSPLPRAMRSAELLLPMVAANAIAVDPALREMNDGLERQSTAPESFELFSERVEQTLLRLAAQHAGQTLIAVTHAGFIVASMLQLLGVSTTAKRARLDPANASVTEWSARDGRWELLRYNCC
ncbi:MAG: histidine phosphatase family protein [Myxococcales bacterium]|nr:histidine phosphatase family protein [Myxococcales bacterium]